MPKKKLVTRKKTPSHPKAKEKKSRFSSMLKIGALVAVLALGGFLWYSVSTYQSSDEEQTGFLVCNKENTVCENSQHIHADIDVQVCGEEVEFGKEKGRTDKQHTHKEENKIHWHARMKVDPVTHKPLDPTVIALASFFEQMEYTFPTSCPTNPSPKMSVTINEKPAPDGLNSFWVDGDKIKVVYQ